MSEARSNELTEADIRRGYDGTRMTIRGFVWFLFWFWVSLAACAAIAWGVFRWLDHDVMSSQAEDAPPPELARTDNPRVSQPGNFPGPNLQPSPPHETLPWQDIDYMRQAQSRVLTEHGWERPSNVQQPEWQTRDWGRPLQVPQQVVTQVGSELESAKRQGTGPTTTPAAPEHGPAGGPAGALSQGLTTAPATQPTPQPAGGAQ